MDTRSFAVTKPEAQGSEEQKNQKAYSSTTMIFVAPHTCQLTNHLAP